MGRKFQFFVDRSQVRHWALEHHLQRTDHRLRPPAHVRRWQRMSIGELWQLDATPDYFLGRANPPLHLIDLVDDCSRMQVGCRLYAREVVSSYLDIFTGLLRNLGYLLRFMWTRPDSSGTTKDR